MSRDAGMSIDQMNKPDVDERIRDFYQHHIKKLEEALERGVKDELPRCDFGFGEVSFDPEDISALLEKLDDFFLAVQRNGVVDEQRKRVLVADWLWLARGIEAKKDYERRMSVIRDTDIQTVVKKLVSLSVDKKVKEDLSKKNFEDVCLDDFCMKVRIDFMGIRASFENKIEEAEKKLKEVQKRYDNLPVLYEGEEENFLKGDEYISDLKKRGFKSAWFWERNRLREFWRIFEEKRELYFEIRNIKCNINKLKKELDDRRWKVKNYLRNIQEERADRLREFDRKMRECEDCISRYWAAVDGNARMFGDEERNFEAAFDTMLAALIAYPQMQTMDKDESSKNGGGVRVSESEEKRQISVGERRDDWEDIREAAGGSVSDADEENEDEEENIHTPVALGNGVDQATNKRGEVTLGDSKQQTGKSQMNSAAASFLGTDIASGKRVRIKQYNRLKGLYIIGKTGSGKTTLLVNLILQDIAAGRGLCFFDTHGDAITDILCRLPTEREHDVILLDLLDDAYAFGLNLFQCRDSTDKKEVSRVTSAIMDVFAKLFTDSGDLFKEAPTMAETLQNLIPVFLAQRNPGMTLAEIPLFLMDETVRTNLLASVKNPIVKNFWNSYNRWKPDQKERLIESTRRRVGNFLADPLVLHIIGQAEATLDFRRIMDEGKILLIKLSREHPLITSLVGSMIVSQIANAAFSRSDIEDPRQRRPFHLYADEYQRFATPTFAELLTEVRKYGIATCVSHQARGQLDHKNRVAALNADNLVVFAVSGEDAQELALQFDATPQRKKQVLKQRTEAIYREWDEWEWTDKEAERFYNDAWGEAFAEKEKTRKGYDKLISLEMSVDRALNVNDGHLYGPRAEWSLVEIQRLVNGEPPGYVASKKKTWDELFVPPDGYFYSLSHRKDTSQGLATRSGLVKLGKPIVYDINDIFTEEEIWQYKRHRTYRQEQFLFFKWLIEYTDEKTDIPLFLRQGGTVTVYEEGYMFRPDAVDEVRLVKSLGANFPEMQQELKKLLLPFYEQQTIWWFVPDPKSVVRYHPPTYEAPNSFEEQEKKNRGKLVDWIHQSSPPAFGRERENKGWSVLGKWDTSYTFPQAVAWLKAQVQSMMEKAKDERHYWDMRFQEIKEKRQALSQQYYVAVHHKDYLGEQPVKDEQTRYVGERKTRYGNEPITRTTDVQWYDLVEELDETPAQRRDAIANDLANPKERFTAWCKLGMQEHIIRIQPFAEPDAETMWQARRERIAVRTRQMYCQSRGDVEDEITARQEMLMRKEPPKPETTTDDDEA